LILNDLGWSIYKERKQELRWNQRNLL